MKSKEALENIKENYPLVHPTNHKLIRESFDTLEQLVYRDTPMKPYLVEDLVDNIDRYVCFYCNATINIGSTISYNKAFNIFCRECGQRLDWSE